MFPATLKGVALKWFMGLGVNTILYWIDMKKIFLKKYQPYRRTRDSKDDIFRMTQHEEENLKTTWRDFCIIFRNPSKVL